MKEVIYKVSFETYQNTQFDDQTDIKYLNDYCPPQKSRAKNKTVFNYKTNNQDKDFYIENYGNPLCEIHKIYAMIVVEKNEDKISLKFFNGTRHRRAGVFWFKVVKNMKFLTINTKTGDMYCGSIQNYQKKKKFAKSLRRNSFFENPLTEMKSSINNFLINFNLSKDSFTNTKESIDAFLKEIDGGRHSETIKDTDRIFKFYLDKRKIKYPNNFWLYSNTFKSKDFKKILKKNDLKIVDSFMVFNNLNGKKVKKSLHSCVGLNISLLLEAKKIFGDDWINQEDDFIIKCLNYSSTSFVFGFSNLGDFEFFNKEELKRIYKIFKLTFFELELDEYTFRDHIYIYSQLKRYGEINFKWASTNISEFRKEHLDWSNTLEFYKKGEYTRIYPQHYYKILKNPIIIGKEDYFPVILDKTSNYNEESDRQSNCVKTYIGRSSSIIISLRKHSTDSEVRSTIQYEIIKDIENDKISVNRVQFLGRFNSKLESSWDEPLLKLDKLMLLCVQDKKYTNVKITKKCGNGIILESDSEWMENTGRLKWSYKEIENE